MKTEHSRSTTYS